MRPEIIAREVAAMRDHGLDAIISCSPENFAYATGFVVPSQPLIRHRHAMAIVTADGGTSLFGVDMEASTIARRAPGVPATIWKEFSDDAMRGRVMAFYAMGALGSPPLGALLLGAAADHIGVPNAFMLGGSICLIAAGISLASLRRRGLVKGT